MSIIKIELEDNYFTVYEKENQTGFLFNKTPFRLNCNSRVGPEELKTYSYDEIHSTLVLISKAYIFARKDLESLERENRSIPEKDIDMLLVNKKSKLIIRIRQVMLECVDWIDSYKRKHQESITKTLKS